MCNTAAFVFGIVLVIAVVIFFVTRKPVPGPLPEAIKLDEVFTVEDTTRPLNVTFSDDSSDDEATLPVDSLST